jgi:hypothetical protein
VAVAIDFDRQLAVQTSEVGGDLPNRKLTSELQAIGSRPKHLPQENLGETHLTP